MLGQYLLKVTHGREAMLSAVAKPESLLAWILGVKFFLSFDKCCKVRFNNKYSWEKGHSGGRFVCRKAYGKNVGRPECTLKTWRVGKSAKAERGKVAGTAQGSGTHSISTEWQRPTITGVIWATKILNHSWLSLKSKALYTHHSVIQRNKATRWWVVSQATEVTEDTYAQLRNLLEVA